MGKALRPRPARLPKKLLRIRKGLGLSQNGMLRRIGFEESITRDYISAYELGKREPPLPVLLEYARVAGVCLDVLVDDDVELPRRLPSKPDHKGK
ncbi:MAG: helix-turn-helix transcriptional regulator [Blastocatellia bacterium]